MPTRAYFSRMVLLATASVLALLAVSVYGSEIVSHQNGRMKEHPPASVMRTEQKIARRISICVVLPFAMISLAIAHIVREPRSRWRLIRMDWRMQFQIAKDGWVRWWEF